MARGISMKVPEIRRFHFRIVYNKALSMTLGRRLGSRSSECGNPDKQRSSGALSILGLCCGTADAEALSVRDRRGLRGLRGPMA